MKPGYKTSEFWLNFLVFLLGAAMASGLIADGSMTATIIGGILSILPLSVYTASRSGVKKAESASLAYVKNKPANANEAAPNPMLESS